MITQDELRERMKQVLWASREQIAQAQGRCVVCGHRNSGWSHCACGEAHSEAAKE